jgi:hypothetical protein
MSMKKGIVGLIIIGVIIVLVASLQSRKGDPAAEVSSAAGEAVGSVNVPQMSLMSRVIVYYFHGNFRCASCAQIERYAKEVIESGFADQIKSGLVSFQAVNVEKSGNQHFVQDYQLYTKAVVLSLQRDGKEIRFKNLDKVWEYLRDRKRFDDYVRSGVSEYLEVVQ